MQGRAHFLWNMCSYRYSSVLFTQSCLTLWTHGAHQAPLSMGFSRQEYWSGLPCPSPGNLPNQGIKYGSSALQADSLTFEPSGKPIFFTGRYVSIFQYQAPILFSFSFRWLALLEIQICIILIFYYYDCSLLDPLPKQVNLFRILNSMTFKFEIKSNSFILITGYELADLLT